MKKEILFLRTFIFIAVFIILSSCETKLEEKVTFLNTKWKYLAHYTNNVLYSNGVNTNSNGDILFWVYVYLPEVCKMTRYSNNQVIQSGTWPWKSTEIEATEDITVTNSSIIYRHYSKYKPIIIDNKYLKLSLIEYKKYSNGNIVSNATYNENYDYYYHEKFE
ncbi:MAG: hypothetical protein N2258_00510 [Brevinematales bacterium]|nr:hypothetical protein [Brevinematales bacterium]